MKCQVLVDHNSFSSSGWGWTCFLGSWSNCDAEKQSNYNHVIVEIWTLSKLEMFTSFLTLHRILRHSTVQPDIWSCELSTVMSQNECSRKAVEGFLSNMTLRILLILLYYPTIHTGQQLSFTFWIATLGTTPNQQSNHNSNRNRKVIITTISVILEVQIVLIKQSLLKH